MAAAGGVVSQRHLSVLGEETLAYYYYLLAGARGQADDTFGTNCWLTAPGHKIMSLLLEFEDASLQLLVHGTSKHGWDGIFREPP